MSGLSDLSTQTSRELLCCPETRELGRDGELSPCLRRKYRLVVLDERLEGATRVTVAAGIDPGRIVRVLDGLGRVIPRLMTTDDREAVTGEAQGWRWWDGALILRCPATAGTWRIESLGGRTIPIDDVSPVDLVAGDDEIIVLLAGATALRRRAIADGKRGHRPREIATLAETMQGDAMRLIATRRRRARGGWLG